jgi:hypothetical protein
MNPLSTNVRIIAYDRREAGASGGRVKQFIWRWILDSFAAGENARVAA